MFRLVKFETVVFTVQFKLTTQLGFDNKISINCQDKLTRPADSRANFHNFLVQCLVIRLE